MTLLHPDDAAGLKTTTPVSSRADVGWCLVLACGRRGTSGRGHVDPLRALAAQHRFKGCAPWIENVQLPEFLAIADPTVVVISVGAGNPFGHPSREMLARLGDRRVFRTDQSGAVEIASDGTRLWIKTER